jgi:thiol:disulfide interchange protein DsbD
MAALLRFCFLSICIFTVGMLSAQTDSAVSFVYSKQRLNDSTVQLTITAKTQSGAKLYALQQQPTDALFSTVSFDSSAIVFLKGALTDKSQLQTENDASVNAAVRFVTDSAVWQQIIRLNAADSTIIKGNIAYLLKQGDNFISGEEAFKFFIQAQPSNTTAESDKTVADQSLWWIFIAAFGGGLLALLTPCVYSMIPVTASFFTKRSKTKAEGKRNAIYYATSIITIFTVLGFLITLIFGPAALNNLATNWIANLIFFVLFLVFGISFLGAFEINLPSSWSTKADSKAGMGNFMGIFFMALTLVVVSFSCTGPIIGNLLVLAAKGSYYGPLVGMFGFSLALALPFALFAFFPSKLNILGKAGGWLNAVKVTLGFLELALALKFLSNADLSLGWRLLDREIFIALWVVIFILLGIYLLGKIKFHHDDELPKNDFGLPYLTVTRLFFAITAFSFAVYMIPGMWGAPLKGISAFVPPMGTQDFNASAASHAPNSNSNSSGVAEIHPVKYYDRMKIYEPEVVTKYGLVTFFDYDEALAAARQLKKPLMIDFTGINCVNCRKMEGQVWSDPAVMKMLKEDFVIVSLYIDVNNFDLPENEHYFSKALGKKVETLGDKHADMQVTKFGANSQPFYFFLDSNENRLISEGYGYDPNIQRFIDHLNKAKAAYSKGK